jgi:GNAT superfamily N-acetyltransferase
MDIQTSILKTEVASLEKAMILLQRFFREEGFEPLEGEMRSSLHAMVNDPDSAVFVAYRGTEGVGVATVTTSLGLEYGKSAELEDLYVQPQARGSGVASALIEAVCAWCRDQDCTTILVTVTPEGETAHGLIDYYQRRGFVDTGRVIMERDLRGPA